MMIFCSNCDTAEAVAKVTHHDNQDLETPLCRTCAEAYEWGQASPDATVEPLDTPVGQFPADRRTR